MWTIAEALRYRLTTGSWNKHLGPSRQKQGHWLRALKMNIKAQLGMDFSKGLMDGLSELISRGLVPGFPVRLNRSVFQKSSTLLECVFDIGERIVI